VTWLEISYEALEDDKSIAVAFRWLLLGRFWIRWFSKDDEVRLVKDAMI